VLALLTLILFWKAFPGARFYLGVALVMYVLAEVMTFGYFYPRNDIMFRKASLTDTALLKKVWSEWSKMNWVRTLIVLAGLCCSFAALRKVWVQPD